MLIDIATAVPPYEITQERAAEELVRRMGGRPAIGRMVQLAASRSAITSRHVVLADAERPGSNGLYSNDGAYVRPGTKTRMEMYDQWSRRLSLEAARNVLASTRTAPQTITRVVTISCTGFVAPGFDYSLIQELELSRSVRRRHIGFMGCSAALIGLQTVFESQGPPLDNGNTLLVSLELCSLHLQTEPTIDNVLANVLFADGCAAAVLSPVRPSGTPVGFELEHSMSLMFEDSSELMGWTIGDFGFAMALSQDLPRVIGEKAVPALEGMLKRIGLSRDRIRHWALHPGGRSILDVLQNSLGLSNDAMEPSRCVLKQYGNMSSATILFVLKSILDSGEVHAGDLCCAVAFGPGLSMEVLVLKAA